MAIGCPPTSTVKYNAVVASCQLLALHYLGSNKHERLSISKSAVFTSVEFRNYYRSKSTVNHNAVAP